jgi:hypothetical protein
MVSAWAGSYQLHQLDNATRNDQQVLGPSAEAPPRLFRSLHQELGEDAADQRLANRSPPVGDAPNLARTLELQALEWRWRR